MGASWVLPSVTSSTGHSVGILPKDKDFIPTFWNLKAMKYSAKMNIYVGGFSDPKSSMGNLCKTCEKDSWLCATDSFTNSSTDSLFVWKGCPMFCFAC